MLQNKAAFIEGIIHGAKVLAWVAGSSLVAYVVGNGLDPFIPHFSQNWPFLVPVVNGAAAAAKRWFDAHQVSQALGPAPMTPLTPPPPDSPNLAPPPTPPTP